jgi:hypothetical protein
MPNASPEITAFDRDGLPLRCAAKVCSGAGPATLRRLLDEEAADALIVHDRRGEPLVLVTWESWNRMARTTVQTTPRDR